MMEVISPGILTTIQDYGRFSYARMGVGKAGAIDGVSLHLANRLVGNPGNTPALEVSVMTPVKFLFHQDTWIAVTGSNCTIVIDGRGQGWHGWRTFIKKGQTVELRPAYNSGMYSYLAVAGGFDAQEVMGSFSTDIKNRLGGHKGDGSPLQKGDHLTFGQPEHEIIQAVGVRAFSRTYISTSIFVLKGPEFEQFDADSQARFFEEEWEISSNSNRMGIRLEGDALVRDQPQEMRSQGVFEGVIQVPPSGQPLVLAAECQSTGGYPRIAVIPQAELWKLAYLPARKKVKFRLIDEVRAREKLEVQQQYLESVEYILAQPQRHQEVYYEK